MALNLQYTWQRKRALVSGGGPAEVDGNKRNRCLEIDAYVPPDSTSNVMCVWREREFAWCVCVCVCVCVLLGAS